MDAPDAYKSSGIRALKTFARTLAAYKSGLLAWCDHPISTGPLEGTNTRIKTLRRQAYNLRHEEYFRLKILALHHSRIELAG
jgi:transposase